MTTHTAITDYYAGADLDDGSLLCHRTTDATVKTASATPELNTGGGVYAPVFTDVSAGYYRLKLLSEGEVVAVRDVYFAGTDGETVQTGVRAELDSASTDLLNDIPTTAEFEARTLAAASYATASQINSLQVNTRASVQVPVEIETPDSGTQVWKIRLFLFDSDGNMEAPDSTPTVALANASGTDRSSRLSAATTLSTGAYSWDYTSTDDDTEEQLNWTFTVVEGGLTRIYPATSYIVEETAYRFTSTDRSTLNSRASSTEVTTVGTAVAAVSTKIGTPAGASVSADIASIKTDTGTTIPGLFTTLTTKIRKFFQLSLRKDAAIATDNATELTEINASGGSGAGGYLNTTDSQEATVDRGDAAWTGGGASSNPELMLSTTIETVTSQTVLVLTAGTAENNAYLGALAVITDSATATQKAKVTVSAYVGSTLTLTLEAAPTFTVAVGDSIDIIAVGTSTGSSSLGPGSDFVTIEIKDDGVGVSSVSVWITSDADGSDVIAGTLTTNDLGRVRFLLTDGAQYYLWAKKTGKISINGQLFTAEADA